MDDLISRAGIAETVGFIAACSYGDPIDAKDVLKAIDEAPTVAAEPVRHGDWLRTSPATWECSVCRAPYRGTPVRPKSRYCHNCGARMDAKEDAHG